METKEKKQLLKNGFPSTVHFQIEQIYMRTLHMLAKINTSFILLHKDTMINEKSAKIVLIQI